AGGVAGGPGRAAGFGFEAYADVPAGEVLEDVEAFAERDEGGAGGLGAPVVLVCPPVKRQRGDGAAGDVVGQQSGEDAGEGGGVLQAFGVGPVRLVDAV